MSYIETLEEIEEIMQQFKYEPREDSVAAKFGEGIMITPRNAYKTVKQALDEGCELHRVVYPYDPKFERVTVLNPKTKIQVSFLIDRFIPDEDKRDAIYNKEIKL